MALARQWVYARRQREGYAALPRLKHGIAMPLVRAALITLLAAFIFGTATAAGTAQSEILRRDITFFSQGVTLHGTVFIPTQPSALAAAVWVDGAGKTSRNPGLAQLLAHHGVAVLTYDKRGVGMSGGVYAGPEVGTNNVSPENLSLLAEDAAAAMHALRRETRLGNVPLGFIGVSQAGWIIPMAALKYREARFMVLWSGAVETTHENFLFERTALADEDFWGHHKHGDDVRKIMSDVVDDLPWANFDPGPALKKLPIPGFWLFGGRDRNVDVDLSIARLEGLIAAGHTAYSYRVFDEYDHSLGGMAEAVAAPSVEWIRKNIAPAH